VRPGVSKDDQEAFPSKAAAIKWPLLRGTTS